MRKSKRFLSKLRIVWRKILVFFGFKIWAKMQYNRPKFHPCAFHGVRMKREGKTESGAFYYCPKCRKAYHLESKGNKLVPI